MQGFVNTRGELAVNYINCVLFVEVLIRKRATLTLQKKGGAVLMGLWGVLF